MVFNIELRTDVCYILCKKGGTISMKKENTSIRLKKIMLDRGLRQITANARFLL